MSGKILAFAAVIAVASLIIFNMEAKNEKVTLFETFKQAHGKFYWTT